MGRQDDENQRRGQSAQDEWARGKQGRVKVGRGKSAEWRTTYGKPGGTAKKTGAGETKGRKTYAAGSNVLDRKKYGTYDESIAGGSRADDPRNWEFHYKEPKAGAVGTSRGKGEGRTNPRTDARNKAQRAARESGKSVYEVKKIEWETAGIKQTTKQSREDSKAMGASRGTSRVGQNISAQKQMAERRRGRGSAQRGSGPFDDAKTKSRSRIA